MATLSTAKAAAGVPARKDINYSEVVFSYALTAALALDDVIRLCKIPAGAVITKLFIFIPDLDTNVSPAITFDVGDDADTDRYGNDITVGQSAGVFDLEDIIAAGFGYVYTAEQYLQLVVSTGPATGAATGTIAGVVGYTVDP